MVASCKPKTAAQYDMLHLYERVAIINYIELQHINQMSYKSAYRTRVSPLARRASLSLATVAVLCENMIAICMISIPFDRAGTAIRALVCAIAT